MDDGDGKLNPQEKPEEKIELKKLLLIQIDKEGHFYITGPLHQKKLCMNALIDGLRYLVNADIPAPPMIQPARPGQMLRFARRIFGKK